MLNKFTKKLEVRIVAAAVTALSLICVISVSAMFDASAVHVTVTEINEFSDENSTKTLKTKGSNVGDFLNSNSLQIGAHDTVNLDQSAPISEATEIIIKRGMPFTIVADGNIIVCSTTKNTVGEALLEVGHYPDEDDLIFPEPDTRVTPELTVSITRVDSNNLVVTEEIPNTVQYTSDDTLEKGKTKIIQEGYPGALEITFKVTYNDGVEISREEISRVVVREPQNKVIANGTKSVATPKPTENAVKSVKKKSSSTATSSSFDNFSYSKKLTMSATGYTAFRADGTRAKTASGRTAGHGLVAVDTSVIPMGTRLYIEGYGEAIAADTGSSIKGNRIDLCFEQSNAWINRNFGRKNVNVYILE